MSKIIFFPKILSSSFFNRPTLVVAKESLGKFLVRRIGKREIAAMITEVEAYVGPRDKASHASRGRTPRTEVMFGKPGHWYIYLIYGIHHCLNIVTEKKGYPAAILIRGVAVSGGISLINDRLLMGDYRRRRIVSNLWREALSGPGRVSKYFQIDRRFNAKLASKRSGLWIEDRASPWASPAHGRPRGIKISPRRIGQGKRIGVDYAGKWKERPWRFFLKD